MHLPAWLTGLLSVDPGIARPDDRDYESDQAAVDEKLAPYRGRRYQQMPPDPRGIDTARLIALRERLLNKYAYRWRQVEAVDEIVDALFDPIVQSDGTRYALCTDAVFLNDKGESPHPRWRGDDSEYKKHFYISVHSLRLGEFLTNYEDAVRLLNSVLPDWGFTARVLPGGTEVRLENGDKHLDWVGGATIATLIVVAMLDLLSNNPKEAKSWRSI